MKIKAISFNKIDKLCRINDREVKGIIILISLFASGMILGAGIWRTDNQNTLIITNILNDFITSRNVDSSLSIIMNLFLFNFIFLLIIILSGFSSIGALFLVIVPIIRGIGYGILSGFLYSEYLMSGIGYYLLTVFPGAILCNVVMIIAINNSCVMSIDLLSVIIGKKQADMTLFKNNLKNCAVYLIMVIVSAVTECITIKAFSYLFRF